MPPSRRLALGLLLLVLTSCENRSATLRHKGNRLLTAADVVGFCQATAELAVQKVNKRSGPQMQNEVLTRPTRLPGRWKLEARMVSSQEGTVRTSDPYSCVVTGETVRTANASVSLKNFSW
ncbi:hypothetical protein V3W47_05155 [Deinococcus sp. YIM 134068]|uniref:hypothetical protein n=1 Tax=Deinococcus lichenicola TaxID=3118910 RepID=UPI002F9290DF